jgi:recombination protein RecR
LLEEFARLPGIGPKSAQRIAYWLLTAETADAQRLADAIVEVKRTIHFCPVCFNFAEGDVCEVCGDPQRDRTKICVVEEPRDLVAIDRAGAAART